MAGTVTELLMGLRDPDGVPLVAAVHRRADLYSGPHVDRAPDLLVTMTDESVDLHDGAPRRRSRGCRAPTSRGVPTASTASSPSRRRPWPPRAKRRTSPSTVLDLLGLDVAGLDGRSLIGGGGDHRSGGGRRRASADARVHRRGRGRRPRTPQGARLCRLASWCRPVRVPRALPILAAAAATVGYGLPRAGGRGQDPRRRGRRRPRS